MVVDGEVLMVFGLVVMDWGGRYGGGGEGGFFWEPGQSGVFEKLTFQSPQPPPPQTHTDFHTHTHTHTHTYWYSWLLGTNFLIITGGDHPF